MREIYNDARGDAAVSEWMEYEKTRPGERRNGLSVELWGIEPQTYSMRTCRATACRRECGPYAWLSPLTSPASRSNSARRRSSTGMSADTSLVAAVHTIELSTCA